MTSCKTKPKIGPLNAKQEALLLEALDAVAEEAADRRLQELAKTAEPEDALGDVANRLNFAKFQWQLDSLPAEDVETPRLLITLPK